MDYVSFKVENHIGLVTINKPPVNSFNRQLYQEVKETFQSIGKMDDVWAVILRAEGKNFSTGNDFNDFLLL
ncbi:MAG: enoyl-CoA hydratase-related protein, partial [Smithellaceae bacterium]|nr:enoyl-CoA hydratase-related protein [Smithellaceae bacterium]